MKCVRIVVSLLSQLSWLIFSTVCLYSLTEPYYLDRFHIFSLFQLSWPVLTLKSSSDWFWKTFFFRYVILLFAEGLKLAAVDISRNFLHIHITKKFFFYKITSLVELPKMLQTMCLIIIVLSWRRNFRYRWIR